VAVFDVAGGRALHTLEGHHKPVRGLSFMPGKWTLVLTDGLVGGWVSLERWWWWCVCVRVFVAGPMASVSNICV
jgi:hypothetical protein